MDCQLLTRLGPDGPLHTHVVPLGAQAALCGAVSQHGWAPASTDLATVTCLQCLGLMNGLVSFNPQPSAPPYG